MKATSLIALLATSLLVFVVACGDPVEYDDDETQNNAADSNDNNDDNTDTNNEDFDIADDCLIPEGGLSIQCGGEDDEDWNNGDEWPGGGGRYVLVEDLSVAQPGDDSPGMDIDSIAINRDGREFFADIDEDFNTLGSSNEFYDTSHALGPPDSQCEAMNYVSLGGEGGYIIVRLEETFIPGDEIIIYELGPTLCPDQLEWNDEDYSVSYGGSMTTDGTWTFIGMGGEGQNVFRIE